MNALERLTTEYENLKKEEKIFFAANPIPNKNGLDLMNWECSFSGPDTPLYQIPIIM